jgi:signal transduction histidine kinase
VIALAHRGDRLQLTIEDDADGIETAPGQCCEVEHGKGLLNISERARTLDGGIEVERYPDGGTRIVISLPELGSAPPSEQCQRLAG